MENYDTKRRNFQVLKNLKEINNNNKIIDIIKNINNNNIKDKIYDIIDLYNNMDKNKMTIIYNNNDKNKIKLFDEDFIKNNKDNCYLIINNKKQELTEYIEIKEQQKLEIKLYETKNITDMSGMFSFRDCSSLSSLPDISKWDTKNITNMSYMFYNCSSLSSLPDISKWDTKNITDMSCMFYNCSSLSSLPDISKWELNEKLNTYQMFEGVDKNIIPEKFKDC